MTQICHFEGATHVDIMSVDNGETIGLKFHPKSTSFVESTKLAPRNPAF